MSAAAPLIIRSEAEAWAALEAALNEGAFGDVRELRFEGWPTFTLDMKGRDWDSTVPTRIMPALLDVQRDLHRAYTRLRYDDPSLRRLRNEEREALEVVVKVEKGSSAFSADLWDQLTELGKAAIARMDGTQATISVLFVALMISANVGWKAWLNARVKEKQIDADNDREKADLAARVELSKLETERMEVMAKAIAASHVARETQEDVQATASQLLKATRAGDKLDRGGVVIQAHEAHELAQTERERAQEAELRGVFRILGNRTDVDSGFRITVQDDDGDVFRVDVPMALAHEQKQLIQQAEWGKGRVTLWIEAERLRGSIVRAEVTRAVAAE